MSARRKATQPEVEQSKTPEQRSWTAKQESETIRALKAFELTILDHNSGALPDAPDPSAEDGAKAKHCVYGDVGAGRATASGGKASGPICVDCFLDRALEHWSEFEDLEEEQLLRHRQVEQQPTAALDGHRMQ